MSERTFPLLKEERIIKESSRNHLLRPGVSLTAKLCHPYLTGKRLVLCEAFYDIIKKVEKGVGDVIHEISLDSIEKLQQCPDLVEPYIEIDVRNANKEKEKYFLFFRDRGWHVNSPQRLGECDEWIEAINKERKNLGFFPEPFKPRAQAKKFETVLSASAAAEAPRKEESASPALLDGNFEITREIDSGGMGVVYEGRDRSLDRPVAIKKMRPDVKMALKDKDLFLQEAKISASLHHPFIVDIYAIIDEADEIYLVFEYVDGETLRQKLEREGPLSIEKARPILKCVVEALSYAHARKTAHRDLKPSNIMMTKHGYAKVMDFGIARQIQDTASKMTQTDIAGTYPYMAPEQELGKFDARSDVFALGVTVYDLLSGNLPFTGPNYYLQKEKGEFKPLKAAAPGVPAEVAQAVERCMRFDPDERFQTVDEFGKAVGAT